jgi:hypothetical protein
VCCVRAPASTNTLRHIPVGLPINCHLFTLAYQVSGHALACGRERLEHRARQSASGFRRRRKDTARKNVPIVPKGAVCAYPNKRMRRRPARAKHAAVGPWRPINHDMTRTLTNPTPGIARTSLERLGVPPCCVGLPARLAKNRMAQTATGHGGPKLFVRSAPKLGGPGSLRSQQEQVLW